MRANARYKSIIALSLIFLLAIFLFSFALSVDFAAADSSVTYLSAEVTTASGDFLPSGIVYSGSEVELGFIVYKSSDRSAWVVDDSFKSNFKLAYRDASNDAALLGAPSAVGSYTVSVVAVNSTLSGYYSDSLQSIIADVSIGASSFRIYNQNLYLYSAFLDDRVAGGTSISGAGDILLPDSGADYYSQVVTGTKLFLGDSEVESVSANYDLVVEYYSAGVYSVTEHINKVGKYRLTVVIHDDVDLSRTQAASLEKDGDDYLFYREFSVTCETISFELNSFSVYADASRDVKLNSASMTKLSAIAGANYETVLLYYPSSEGVARVIAADGEDSDLYHPTEVGSYVYRVIFTTDLSTYGISVGDYVDLSFDIKPVPYVVHYQNDEGTEITSDTIPYDGTTALVLNPIFRDLDGVDIGSVIKQTGEFKYSSSYAYYNGAEWLDENIEPIAPGLYKIIVTFSESATVGTYTIPSVIEHLFRIVKGDLEVGTSTKTYNMPLGELAIPTFTFTSQRGDESATVGAYTVKYYKEDGTYLGTTAPTEVGGYVYELTVTNAIEDLHVTAGATYRGSYSITYRPIDIGSQGSNVVFRDGIDHETVLLDGGEDDDFTIRYYKKSGNILKTLSDEPETSGEYIKQFTAKKALEKYRVAIGDVYSYSYSIAGSSTSAVINTSSLDLTYDGGVKIPSVSFTKDTVPILLTPLVDYQVAYYKERKVDESTTVYDPCDAPLLAGKYRCVVTFLKDDAERGLSAGSFALVTYVIAPAQYNVTFSVSEASVDLVYDAKPKAFDLSFTYKSRPITVGASVKYATTDGEFGDAAFTNVGTYRVKAVLADDKSGSLKVVHTDVDKSGGSTLNDGPLSFEIVKLSLRVVFEVPLGYNRMWVNDETIVAPVVKYTCINGRYKDTTLTAADFAGSSYLIDLGETVTYHRSNNSGISYDVEIEPKTPGDYKQSVALTNANVVMSAVWAVGDDNGVVQEPALAEGVASQRFMVTPREVLVKYTYDAAKDSLYYTGDSKGVTKIDFMAYDGATHDYTTDVSALFADDYHVYYMISDSAGTIPPGTEGSLDKPDEKSYYVARVLLDYDPDSEKDHTYLTKYTFKEGRNQDGLLEESALSRECYVDDVFRIKDQNKLDVVFNMPETFAANGKNKVISAVFYNNFSVVGLEEGEGKDYKITYLNEDDDENTTSYSEVGTYRLKMTFLKDNVAYRLESYAGVYSGSDNLYIKEGDTLVYTFSVFPKRQMKVALVAPDSMYYDNTAKAYAARFTVEEDKVECTVTLTEGTHYRLRYYDVDAAAYLSAAPVVPGNYDVEVVFLMDLLDYTYEGKDIKKDGFYTISESPSEGKVATPRTEEGFTIKQAVLVIGGVKAMDKSFDGTTAATFNESIKTVSIKVVDGKKCGENVHNVTALTLIGSLSGSFVTDIPGEGIAINLDEDGGKYSLPAELSKYYILEHPALSASISKAIIEVRLKDSPNEEPLVSREYNPYAIDSTINYRLQYDEALLTKVFPDLDLSALTVGELSYEKGEGNGNSVGKYLIVLNDLRLNDESGVLYSGKKISDLFDLSLQPNCYYEIKARAITLTVTAGQNKIYGDADPADGFDVKITDGRLIYGDSISYVASRKSGETIGSYLIEISDVRVTGSKGENVGSNYNITVKTDYFHINKRKLLIVVPENQTTNYHDGFAESSFVRVSDITLDEAGKDVTAEFLLSPAASHDRLSGKLAYLPTDDPLKFLITQGSLNSVVNALGKNVSSNYEITFFEGEEPKYYVMTPINVKVKLSEKAVLQKYYGDKEPIIAFEVIDNEENKLALDGLTIASASSIGRDAGENAGVYYLKNDNIQKSFFVYDNGIDVSDYFSFTVMRWDDTMWREVSDVVFTILPRPIIVTVEDVTYQNTGRAIAPTIKYLNANGSRLSATLREDVESKMNFVVPEVAYIDGENMVTPVLEGEADPNYQVTLQAGRITVVYMQNVITVTPISTTDEIYESNGYIFSGIMLYKSVRFYRIETANGEQPTRELSISLPVDKEVAGDGLVVVALRQDGSSKAFSFEQSGQTIVYQDNGAYYVAIAEVQEWFYVIWGVVIVIALVALYFLIRLLVFLIKKLKKKAAANATKPKKEKKKKKDKTPAGAFTPSESGANAVAPATNDSDSLFSDSAVIDSAPRTAPAPVAPVEESAASDDMFTDVAPTESAAPVTPSAPLTTESDAASDALVSDAPVVESAPARVAPVAPVTPVTPAAPTPAPAPIEEDPKAKKKREKELKELEKKEKKEKKEREKREKEAKKNAKMEENKPKGFMPSSFKPKGDRSAAYAPTRSFTEDLFNEDPASLDIGDSMLSDSNTQDDAIVVPPTSNAGGSGDDELIISRGGGFALEDDADEVGPDGKKKTDGDE